MEMDFFFFFLVTPEMDLVGWKWWVETELVQNINGVDIGFAMKYVELILS